MKHRRAILCRTFSEVCGGFWGEFLRSCLYVEITTGNAFWGKFLEVCLRTPEISQKSALSVYTAPRCLQKSLTDVCRLATPVFSCNVVSRGRKKAHKPFQHKLFGSHPNPPILGPQQKSLCASFPGKSRKKRDPHQLFRGDFWGQKRGPKQAIFGHKKFVLFFFCP